MRGGAISFGRGSRGSRASYCANLRAYYQKNVFYDISLWPKFHVYLFAWEETVCPSIRPCMNMHALLCVVLPYLQSEFRLTLAGWGYGRSSWMRPCQWIKCASHANATPFRKPVQFSLTPLIEDRTSLWVAVWRKDSDPISRGMNNCVIWEYIICSTWSAFHGLLDRISYMTGIYVSWWMNKIITCRC